MFRFTLLLFIVFTLPVQADGIDKLSKQLDVMQKELRLVTKEVIGLSAKLDALKVSQLRAREKDGGKKQGGIDTILLNSKTYQSPKLGSEDAKYAIVEFSDYECPFCRRHATQVFPQIKKLYIDTGKLLYIVRDFPLGFHSNARSAATVAHCAQKQSKFWEMNEALIKNSTKLNNDLYQRLAKELKLDETAFNKCLVDPKIAKRIDADIAYGEQVGVQGTPRFYIGKVKGDSIVDAIPLTGAQPMTAFDRVIQRVMSKS